MLKNIKIEFTNTWEKFGIDNDIAKILKNGIVFQYDKNTTIRDLLIYLTKSVEKYFYQFESCNLENEYEDISLNSNFAYLYENFPTFIYNIDLKLYIFIQSLNIEEKMIFEPYFATFEGGGDIWRIDGIRYYMNSKENTSHNIPHIHVEYQGEEVSISIIDGKILAGGIKKKVQKESIERIMLYRRELALEWNTRTDGKDIDIDEMNFTLGG